ncbi:MAG: Holliday junction resolvase RuvX [Patescibacteria group bacterium]|nr:Holliday junction resolvase RuvX [Patescibacteria group bacterium]MDD4304631.1 Holliday junction resolvase RuvX [Patescibacteria group bacterium]MDD4695558.1 Holliday junction resolvase RuvX [Patescibacteria group bacterium]
MTRFLGIDYGSSKIGLALGDNELKMAFPFKILSEEFFWTDIKSIISRENIDEIVLGLPKNLENNDTNQTNFVLEFLKKLRSEINLPIHLEDERMTSLMSQGMQGKYVRSDSRKSSRKNKIKIKSDDDASAAAIILESYIKRNYDL